MDEHPDMSSGDDFDGEPVVRPRRAARYVGIVLGLLGITAVIVAVVYGGKHFDALIAPLYSNKPFAITLNKAEVEGEIEHLRTLQSATLPASLGAVADAKVDCATRLLADRPSEKAKAAAARYFVVLFAAQQQVQSALINPLLLEGGGVGKNKLRRFLVTGVARKDQDERLHKAGKAYGEIANPLYAGLDLENTSWAQSDLQRLLLAASTDTDQLAECTRKRVGG